VEAGRQLGFNFAERINSLSPDGLLYTGWQKNETSSVLKADEVFGREGREVRERWGLLYSNYFT